MRAPGRPSVSTVASAIAVALRISLRASSSHAFTSGSGSSGKGSGSADLNAIAGVEYPAYGIRTRRPLPEPARDRQGREDVPPAGAVGLPDGRHRDGDDAAPQPASARLHRVPAAGAP